MIKKLLSEKESERIKRLTSIKIDKVDTGFCKLAFRKYSHLSSKLVTDFYDKALSEDWQDALSLLAKAYINYCISDYASSMTASTNRMNDFKIGLCLKSRKLIGLKKLYVQRRLAEKATERVQILISNRIISLMNSLPSNLPSNIHSQECELIKNTVFMMDPILQKHLFYLEIDKNDDLVIMRDGKSISQTDFEEFNRQFEIY